MKTFEELIIVEIETVKNAPKLFREHRGGLDESLKTTMLCPNGLADIVTYFKMMNYPNPCPYVNIRLDMPHRDNRLPKEWGERQYMVIADTAGLNKTQVVIGYCNFWENLPV